MGRFCTQRYENPTFDNFQNKRIHLTNFEVNRFNEEEQKVLYVGETDETQIIDLEPNFRSKQSLTEVLNRLDNERECFKDLSVLNIKPNS